MNSTRYAAVIAAVAVIGAGRATAQEFLSGPAAAALEQLAQAPAAVYMIDKKEDNAAAARIDAWVRGQIRTGKAVTHVSKKGAPAIVSIAMSRNVPVFAGNQATNNIKVDGPYTAFYKKGVGEMSFIKDLHVPIKTPMPDSQAIAIAEQFILQSKFHPETRGDARGMVAVNARRSGSMDSNSARQGSVTTEKIRVTFNRQFMGYPVFNAKQMVDIHPGSGEILGYKSRHWAPALDKSTRTLPLVAVDSLKNILAGICAGGQTRYRVEKIQIGYFQSQDLLFPVLAAAVTPIVKPNEPRPMGYRCYVNLVQGIDMKDVTEEK